mgnify:CR=1 FL=1
MHTRTRRFRSWLWAVALPVLALLTWAGWEEPSLHHYAAPTRLTIVRVGGLTDATRAQELYQRIRSLDGVTACTITPATQLAVVAYETEHLSEAEVRRALSAGGAYAVAPAALAAASSDHAGPARPQCPVPASYLVAIDRFRFALNVRRLFVRGV